MSRLRHKLKGHIYLNDDGKMKGRDKHQDQEGTLQREGMQKVGMMEHILVEGSHHAHDHTVRYTLCLNIHF